MHGANQKSLVEEIFDVFILDEVSHAVFLSLKQCSGRHKLRVTAKSRKPSTNNALTNIECGRED